MITIVNYDRTTFIVLGPDLVVSTSPLLYVGTIKVPLMVYQHTLPMERQLSARSQHQGTHAEGDGSVPLISSFKKRGFVKSKNTFL